MTIATAESTKFVPLTRAFFETLWGQCENRVVGRVVAYTAPNSHQPIGICFDEYEKARGFDPSRELFTNNALFRGFFPQDTPCEGVEIRLVGQMLQLRKYDSAAKQVGEMISEAPVTPEDSKIQVFREVFQLVDTPWTHLRPRQPAKKKVWRSA